MGLDNAKNMPARKVTVKNPLTGTWQLQSVKGEDTQGQQFFPFEEDVAGMLHFNDSGQFGMQVYNVNIPRFSSQDPYFARENELRMAFLGHLTLVGRYEATPSQLRLTVDNSSFPNWKGNVQSYGYVLHDNSLRMKLNGIRLNGIVMDLTFRWTK
jgi:hypothetical protein